MRSAQSACEEDLQGLLAAAARGESLAWTRLYERYHSRILAITRAQGLSDADAADAAQETWIVLLEHIGDIREPEALLGWLATTARRRSIRRHQRSAREIPVEEMTDLHPVWDDVDERLHAEQLLAALHQAVACLSHRERALVDALLDPQELSYREISLRLTMPVGSIGPVRQRALRRLRAHLAAETSVSAFEAVAA